MSVGRGSRGVDENAPLAPAPRRSRVGLLTVFVILALVVGLALIFLTLTFISQVFNLEVIGWIIRSLSVFLAIALVVITAITAYVTDRLPS